MNRGVKLAAGAAAIFALGAGAATVATGALKREDPTSDETVSAPSGPVDWDEARQYEGQTITVCGPVAGNEVTDGGVSIHLGAEPPEQDRFTVFVRDEEREAQEDICATGEVTVFAGVPRIELASAEDGITEGDGTALADNCDFFINCPAGSTDLKEELSGPILWVDALEAAGYDPTDFNGSEKARIDITRSFYAPWDEAHEYVGQYMTICGPIISDRRTEAGTFVNIGYDYPDPNRFSVVIWNKEMREAAGRSICAVGEVALYDGVPQIQVHDEDYVFVKPDDLQ